VNDSTAATSTSDDAPAPARSAARTWLGRHKPILILFASLICVGMGQTLVFAVLPPAARDLGLSEVQVGGIFTVSAFLWMLMSPFWGERSDSWGRRPVILLGLSGYAVSMLAFAVSLQISLAGVLSLLPAYALLIASRSIYGFFGSAAVPAAQAYVADRTSPFERGNQLALLSAAFALGLILGPAVVAALLGFGLTAPFYAVGLLGLLSVAAVARYLPEEIPAREHRTRSPRLSPLDSRVLPFLLVAVALELAQAIALQATGFYAMDVLGLGPLESARAVGVALMGTAAAVLVAQLILIPMLQLSPRAMMGGGAVFAILGFAAIVVAQSYAVLFGAMTVLGLAFGLMRPGVMAGASLAVGMSEQGGVAGLMNATGGIGVVVAPFIGMSLYQFMPQAPYVLSLLLAAAVLVGVLAHRQLRAAQARELP
jgi:MFS family permease